MMVKISGNPIESISRATDKVNQAADAWDTFIYWINPVHWWDTLGAYVVSPEAFFSVAIATCLLIGLWGLGAQWPKKAIFWGNIVFWILRGAVFS